MGITTVYTIYYWANRNTYGKTYGKEYTRKGWALTRAERLARENETVIVREEQKLSNGWELSTPIAEF